MSMYCIVFTPSYLPIALVVQVEMGQASLSVCPANNFSRTWPLTLTWHVYSPWQHLDQLEGQNLRSKFSVTEGKCGTSREGVLLVYGFFQEIDIAVFPLRLK